MVDTTRPPARHRTRPSHQTAGSASSGGPSATAAAQAPGVRHRERPAPVHLPDASLPAPQGCDSCPPSDYDVGYGKPPKHGRFKPGRSGNPRGRPKGSKNLLTVIDGELDRLIAVREDGKSRKVRARDALAKRLVHKGLSGHDRSIEFLFKLAGLRSDPGAVAPAEAAAGDVELLTAGDRSILERFKQRVIEEHKLTAHAVGADKPEDEGGSA